MEQRKNEVLPGTLNLMVLKTLDALGPLHGYGIARRIEQLSGNLLQLNQGTIYPALLHLGQMGWIALSWVCQKTTGGLNITRSHEQGGNSLPPKKRIGSGHPQ
jgi:DNA-binding PadR family transcriptional regulator